jgi:hypothetical protein
MKGKIMSTGQQHHNETYDLSFERVNSHIRRFDLSRLIAATAVETQPDRGQRLIAAYAATRPLLVAMSVIKLVPAHWRAVLRILINTLDEVSLSFRASFKAGKDLAVGDGSGSSVEMEPKLPVG